MMAALSIIRQWYEQPDKALLQPDMVWELSAHFPNGGRHEGRDDIFTDVFGPLMKRYPNWRANIDTLFDAGPVVVATGLYTASDVSTGDDLIARFVHLWEVTDGLISRHRQYVEPKF